MPRHGLKFKLYISALAGFTLGTDDLLDDATWALVTRARDLSLPTERETAENKDRGDDFVGEFVGHRSLAIEGGLTPDVGDTGYDALKAAYLAGSLVGVLLLDDLITVDGAAGEVFFGYVSSFPLSAAMAESAGRTFRIGLAADSPEGPEQVSITIA